MRARIGGRSTRLDPTVDPTPSVSDTISGATDPVSDVASGATDTVTGTTGTVSGAASDATGSDATSGAGAVSREGSTRMVVGASGGAGGGTAASEGGDGGRCDPQTSTCIGGTSDDGALTQALERILGFLAQTGLSLAGWIAVAGGLGLLGTLILLRTRRRASNGPSRPVV